MFGFIKKTNPKIDVTLSTLHAPQVLEFRFPGHPAPPLGLLFKMCTSLDAWLDADPSNVAAVHCLTGKGRTATVTHPHCRTPLFVLPRPQLPY